jgi:eukaryotic-like serine/threonine-protein kinase
MSFPLKHGEVLRGRYQIRERIGQGGMGSIYLSDDLRLSGRLCAVKEVRYDRNLPDKVLKQAREQFFREATVLARMDHPNLPKVSDFFSSGQRDYLVMDFVPGNDLRTLMLDARRHKTFLVEKDVLNWANQLADALSFLHSQEPSIVHRDIKPSNLKLTPSGLLKLVDFGLVKIMAPEEVTITIIQGQGTALYTPLEQYGGRRPAHRCTRRHLCFWRHALSLADKRIPCRCAQTLPPTRKPAPASSDQPGRQPAHRTRHPVGHVPAPGPAPGLG